MNDNPIISLPVSADLSAYSHVGVKLTSTGIALAGAGDRVIGTMVRGNSAAANTGDTVIGRAAAVKLAAGNGLHFVTIGNNTAIAMADELEQWPNGRYVKRGSTLSCTGADTGDLITCAGHGLTDTTPVTFISATSGDGFTVNTTYYVVTATTDTFQLAATSGGAAVAITTNYVGLLLRPANIAGVAGLAVDSTPTGGMGGIINALLFNSHPGTGARVLTAATTLTAADSGKTMFLALDAGFIVTLPAPVLGLRFKFIISIANTAGDYSITSATADTIAGSVLTSGTAAADFEAAVTADNLLFLSGQSKVGDTAIFESDGNYWYSYAICTAAAGASYSG